MYDWAYGEYNALVYPRGVSLVKVPVVTEDNIQAEVSPRNDVILCVAKDSVVKVDFYLPRFVFADIKAGSEAGEMIVHVDGSSVGAWPLCWAQDVDAAKGAGLSRWRNLTSGIMGIYYF